MTIVKEYLSNLELGEVKTYQNMTTVALNGFNFPEFKYLTLNEAMVSDSIEITEIDDIGNVPTLNVINKGNLPVLLFDGEELKGAKQNRVLNTTVIIPEHTEQEIPVSCTEQGRWSYTSPKFKSSETIASSNLRRYKNMSVSESLFKENNYHSNQGEVWEKVDVLCDFIDEDVPTRAMSDVFEAKKDSLDDYIKEFPFNNQNGILIFINGELKGMELLSTENNYEKYHEKIIKSYSIDALIDIEESHKNVDFIKESKEFISEVANMNFVEKPSVGYGYDCRFVNDNIVGAMLIHENSIIHGAFFKKITDENDCEDEVVSSSQRARNYVNY